MLANRDFLEPEDFSKEEMEELFGLAGEIVARPEDYSRVCEGKILSTLFFEPSTRTRLSFEAAMLRLGGKVIGFSDGESSSAMKGESIADTVRTVSCYSDIMALRHQKEGAPKVGAGVSTVPLINAGDGGHHHPTQTLTDLMTIYHNKGGFDGLTLGFCGDLKFGRTVHSLISALAGYKNMKFYLISPEELIVPEYIRKKLEKNNVEYHEVRKLEDVIGDLDVLYMTRVQKERFFNEEDYVRLKDSYILTAKKMRAAREDMIVLHPLPRVNEISPEVDSDPRSMYFIQVKNGMYVRMALIMKLLGLSLDSASASNSASDSNERRPL